MRRRKMWIVQLVAAAALLLAVVPAATALQLGVNLQQSETSGADLGIPQFTNALGALRPARIRHDLIWSGLEPARGSYDETVLAADRSLFARLAAQGIAVDIAVFNTPSWAENGGHDPNAAPANPQDFADFMGHLAGEFKGVVASYATWNGPDSPGGFSGSLADYLQMQRGAYAAIKAADPNATVLVGTLYGYDYAYMQQYLAAGGAGSFDGISVNADLACGGSPYNFKRDASGMVGRYSFLGFTSLHAVAPTAPIWLSEFGWSTTSACSPPITEEQQATYLQQAVHCLSAAPYVPVAEWYELQDLAQADKADNRFGLLRPDFSQKPAFAALQGEIASGDHLQGSCGDFTGPAVTVSKPRAGRTNRGPLAITVKATDPDGVRRIALTYDGTKRIRFFDARPPVRTLSATLNWFGASKLKPGPHTLTITAIDAKGNATTRTVSFVERR